jgi:hypothetical protein
MGGEISTKKSLVKMLKLLKKFNFNENGKFKNPFFKN